MKEIEPNFNMQEGSKNLEAELREKGFQIKRAQLPENEPIQCEECMKEDCFKFYNEGWFIEGEFYCSQHKENALSVLEEVDKDVERRRAEQERIVKERLKRSGLK